MQMPRKNSSPLLASFFFIKVMIVASCLFFMEVENCFAQTPPAAPAVLQPQAAVSGEAIAPAPERTTPGAAPELPTPPAGEIAPVAMSGIPKSMFLSAQDHVKISNAMSDYQNYLLLRKSGQEDIVSQKPGKPGAVAKQEKPQQHFYTYPQFFLESLVYHSANDWVVRVNGHKIMPPLNSDETHLSVISVDNERVVFRWKPEEMARVLESWEKRPESKEAVKVEKDNVPMQIDFNAPPVEVVPSALVTVDKERRLVTFSLHSNQTFSSYAMRVLEGKVRPMTVENKVSDLPPSSPAASGMLQGDAVAIDDSNSGLNGLMKTMDKH